MEIYAPGALIANKYEIASRPLMGGMGIVYLCLNRKAGQPVALKTFKPEYLPDRTARDRFLQEGTAWVTLGKHPNIVQCYGVEYVGDGREIYLVLELIAKPEGYQDASLRSWLKNGKPLPINQALLFALQLVYGMQYACTILPGFIHRDLKPENLLVGADRLPGWDCNRLRITDFGLIGLLTVDDPLLLKKKQVSPVSDLLHHTTRIKNTVGTPRYMAPEQWQGQALCPQTDVFALGCILGEMLTGYSTIPGDTWEDLQQNSVRGKLRPYPAGFPKSMALFLEKCLANDPSERYLDWDILLKDLEKIYSAITGLAVPDAANKVGLDRTERARQGWAFSSLGRSYLDIGHVEEARRYFEQVQVAAQVEGERDLELVATVNLGVAWKNLGDVRRAVGFYEKALNINREVKNKMVEESALSNLGLAFVTLGDLQRAIGYYDQALAIDREIGYRHGEGINLSNLGLAYKNLGDERRSIDYYEQSLKIDIEIRDRRGEETDLENLGNAYLELGDENQAIWYFEQALVIAREIGDRRGEGSNLNSLGGLYIRVQDAPQAILHFEQALEIAREIGNLRGQGATLDNLGSAYALLGKVHQAIEYYEHALEILREIGDLIGVARTAFNLAIAYGQQGQVNLALPLAIETAQYYSQIGHPEMMRRTQRLISRLQGQNEPGPDPAEFIRQFSTIIGAAVDGANGVLEARAALEEIFPQLDQNGLPVSNPIRRIWAGERNEAMLSEGLDFYSALLIREILQQIQR